MSWIISYSMSWSNSVVASSLHELLGSFTRTGARNRSMSSIRVRSSAVQRNHDQTLLPISCIKAVGMSSQIKLHTLAYQPENNCTLHFIIITTNMRFFNFIPFALSISAALGIYIRTPQVDANSITSELLSSVQPHVQAIGKYSIYFMFDSFIGC